MGKQPPYTFCLHPAEEWPRWALPSHYPAIVSVHRSSASVAPHYHDFVEIVLIFRGSCRHTYLGVEMVLGPGDVFVVLPDEPHCFDMAGDMEIYNCLFFPSALGGDWPALADLGGLFHLLLVEPIFRPEATRPEVLHLDPSQREAARQVLERLRGEQAKQAPGTALLIKALLLEFLVLVGRSSPQAPTSVGEAASSSRRQDMLRQALEHIECDYSEDLRVEALASLVHLSPDHFRRTFRRLTGLSPLEYINQIRMRRAVQLLTETSLPVTEVASQVGIADPSHFSRVFRQYSGLSPREFRRERDV